MNTIQNIYFLGIGGIGMSNLVRYFLAKGKNVAGYDRTQTTLTEQLTAEGACIHYHDSVDAIPPAFTQSEATLVVYTPAIPANHSEMEYFRTNGFRILKRAQILGEITKNSRAICCAGTHGKTTTSSMTAHILKQSHLDCNAFLGGILKNYDSNLLLSETSDLTVIEADEYDRSFHWLHPYMALISSADPDHLDIYGTEQEYLKSFEHFTSLISPGGALVMRKGLPIRLQVAEGVRVYTYSENEGDFHARNIRIGGGTIVFDFVTPDAVVENIELGVPVKINIENSVGSMALAWLCGATAHELRSAMATFAGAKRRFDFHLKTDNVVLVDDYAHHPQELTASISSVKALYPYRKLTAVFQPHLFSRTRDFADDFARSLEQVDELVLLDIYPAREQPIEGITSQMLFDKIALPNKTLCTQNELLNELKTREIDVLLTVGAGDIDTLIPAIKAMLEQKQ